MTDSSSRSHEVGADRVKDASLPRTRRKIYGDAEVARILQVAADLQERAARNSADRGVGLTLADLRQAAKEAGIDPRFIDVAAARSEGPVARRRGLLDLLLGARRWDFRSEIPGNLDVDSRSRLVPSIRSAMGQDGEVVEVFGRLEWRHDDSLGPVSVGIAETADTTEINVSASRTGEAGLVYGLGIPFGGLLGGSAVAEMLGVAGSAMATPIALFMGGVAYWIVRLGWAARSGWWERHLQRKTEQLASMVQEAVTSSDNRADG